MVTSFIISVVSLALQLIPKPERITIDNPEVEWVQEPMKPILADPLPLGNRTLVGPFYWRVTFNNKSERAVSITGVDAMIEDSKWGRYIATGAVGGVFQPDARTPALPLTIPAYESRSVLFKGSLPGWLSLKAQAACLKPEISISDFNLCAMRTGTDIFGNKLQIIEDQGRMLGATWPSDLYQPVFALKFISGSGKTYETRATVVPMLGSFKSQHH